MSYMVHTSHDSCIKFQKRKIVDTLMTETDVKEHESMKIARAVERQVKKLKGKNVTTSQIREMVNEKLLERGFVKEAKQHQRVGIPVAEIKNLIRGHNTDNANLQRNPETTHKFVADAALKQYALLCLPEELARAHEKGELHCHDLEYFPARPINCLQHDLRWFIKNGLSVDGNGEHTSVAAPPKRLETLMNHCGEIMLAGQQNCSGGQGMSLWNVFAAPFCKRMSYKKIKQKVQMFIFNLNMAYSNRGGQVPFTSINIEFGVPDFLKNEPAWGPGGKPAGVYGDWEEEVRKLNRAFIEVMSEGDAMGKPHLFPNSIWMLRDEFLTGDYDEEIKMVHELSAKFSTPYFANVIPRWTGGHSNVMGCRTRLNTNWSGDWDVDTLRTGNLAYVTINLPRIAYKVEGYKNGFFYEELDRVLGLAEEILLIRREHALKCLNEHKLLPFLAQKDDKGETYYRIENATLSFGFVGMHETIQALGIKDGIVSERGQKIARNILQHINDYAKDLTEETGYRWTVLQTPGESTCHRFATLDKQHFSQEAIVQGDKGEYYYTNSSHIPVDENKYLIPEKIKIENQFHPLTSGGHIYHGFIGEAYPDPDAMMGLTKKITKSDLGFWAYTSAFSYCFACNTFIRGLQYLCTECGSSDKIEHYSRITGYLQQVGHKKDSAGGWNAGKKAELKDRYEHKIVEEVK